MSQDAARLFLITPPLAGTPGERAMLSAALGAGDVACVLVRHAAPDERRAKAILREVGAVVQRAGAALLIEGDARLAAHADADGVQVPGVGDALEAAIDSLKPERIVGCGGLASRDDAMLAGEKDVDYLLFGDPGPHGEAPDPAWTLERVQWWAEIFNVPCVGFAQDLDDVEDLAVHAEFVALGDAVFGDPRGPAAAVKDAMASLERAAARALAAAR